MLDNLLIFLAEWFVGFYSEIVGESPSVMVSDISFYNNVINKTLYYNAILNTLYSGNLIELASLHSNLNGDLFESDIVRGTHIVSEDGIKLIIEILFISIRGGELMFSEYFDILYRINCLPADEVQRFYSLLSFFGSRYLELGLLKSDHHIVFIIENSSLLDYYLKYLEGYLLFSDLNIISLLEMDLGGYWR